MADRLLGIMREASVELALPMGTITREARRGNITERTTIDLVWMSTELIGQLIRCRIASEIEQSSDHLPIATEIATQDAVVTQDPRKRRLWSKMDIEAFDTSLGQEIPKLKQNPLTNRDDIEKVVEDLTQAISKAVDCATPWARPCEYSKPWWTPECQEAVRLTRQARNLYTRTQSQEAWEAYLRYKNLKGKVIKRAKSAAFRRHIEKASQTQAGIWRTARWAAQRAKGLKQVISIPTLIRNAHETHTPREKAEILK
jgi:hypothetical protein